MNTLADTSTTSNGTASTYAAALAHYGPLPIPDGVRPYLVHRLCARRLVRGCGWQDGRRTFIVEGGACR